MCEKGVPFIQGIYPEIKVRGNSLGLLAGSNSSYTKFHKLYYKMIEEVHGFDPNNAKLEYFDLLKPNT
jgi:hypothetical protein